MKEKLTIGTHNNKPIYWDFSKSPHLGVLGQTGAGNSKADLSNLVVGKS